MKKNLLFVTSLVALLFISCGEAAENREKMHNRAKEFQDSIANVIRQSMQAAEMPGQAMPQAAPVSTVLSTPPATPAQAPAQK
jgi:hypothetical protein